MVELAGSTAKRVSDKRVVLDVCDKPWLVFDWEEHGSHPRIELVRRRPQGLRHRRPQPGFVAGVQLLNFGVIQSIDLICGECFPTDRQSISPSLASRRDRSESFTAFLHQFFILLWRLPVEPPRLDQRQRPAGQQPNQLINQFVTVHFAYYKPAGPSNMECDSAQTLCDLPNNEIQQYQMSAKHGDQQSVSNRKHCYTTI